MDIMEEAEDITSTFKGSRSRKRISLSSILKASPSRQALAHVDANQREVTNIVNPRKAERRKRRRSSKRVSFANTNEVKEFLTAKDAQTLGIFETSAVMEADNRHSYESTSQIPPVVSVGPGHHITGLETLLTAPIVQQPQMAEESPGQNDEGVDAVLSKIMKNFRAQQETSVENMTSPEVNLDPEPEREEQTSIAPSDFFKRITFDRPARSRDQAECGEMSERTIFFKQNKDPEDGNMEMTGNYDNTIHQETEVTQQFKQQDYIDNLGVLGPAYTCRMKAYESSDTSSLHNSSVNNSANISNLSSRETGMRTGSQGKPQDVDNITRVFSMEDASADMELTQVHGIKSRSVRRDDRIMNDTRNSGSRGSQVNNPDLVKIASDDLTRVFNQEDQTGMMEMTKCIDADQRNYQTRDRQPLGLSEQSRGTGYEEMTRVYGQGDVTAGMEFTEPIPAREIERGAEERTRIFQTDDQAGAMDMTSVCNVSGRVLPAVGKQEDDKTVVFDLRGGTSGDVELTECLQVYPLDKENHCPATSGVISRQHLHESMSVASKIDRTKIYQTDDGAEMEMTECVNPIVHSRNASKQTDQLSMSAGAKQQGEMLFGNQDAGVEDGECQHKDQKQNDKSCVSLQAGNRKPKSEGLDQHLPTKSSRVKDERDKENMLVVMPEPTVELGDISLLPCGPLDSTHIFQNEHLGRRSAFFPSSALKQQREEQNDTSMNAANTSTCRESTRKVMEGINALLASNSSTEKTRQALQALSSREAKMYGSRQSKAKVGLFQEKSAKCSSSMPTQSHEHKDDGKKTLKIADERKRIQETAKLPVVSSSQRDRLCDLTSELPSMLLNTTSSMRYSSMTLDDDLLNSTNHPPTAKTLSSRRSKTPVTGKKIIHSDIEATVEVTATYNKQTKETVRGDITSTRPPALHPADTLTRRFSADDEGDMEFTSCVNEKIDSNLDKENVFPSSMASSRRNVSFPQGRPQMFMINATNNHPKIGLEGQFKVQDGHQNDENQTRRFGSDDTAGMEFTACLPPISKGTDRLVSDRTTAEKTSQVPAFVEDQTRRFGSDDTAGMEFTACVPPISKGTDRLVSDHTMAGKTSQVPAFVEDQTRRFGSDDTAGMEFTACVPPISKGTDRLVSDHTMAGKTSQVPAFVEDQTRRFGSDDTAGMEFTACVPPISKGTDRLVSDHTMAGKTSQVPAFVEDQTRRFGSDDTAGMEFTACVPPISKGTDRLVSDHTTAGKTSQAPAFVEDQTRRFGSDDTAGMEFTACVPPISKGTDRIVSDRTMAGKTSQVPAFVEDQTRRFGSDDTAGMEFTACVPPISKGTDRLVSDHTMTGKTSQVPAFVEDQTRRFGSDDTAGMEFTACVPPISKGTDRIVSDHTMAGKTSQAPAFIEDQTRRFGSDDTAGMEFTACVPPISKGTDRLVSDHTMAGKTSQAPAFVEDQTRQFGSDDAGGMEFTACVPSVSKETGGIVSDPTLNTSQKHTVHTMREDETRHFGVNDGEKMEFTACVKDQLDDPPSDGTIQTVRSNAPAEKKVSSKEEEKTQIYRDGMTEMMDLTNIHFKAQTDQDHLDGSPPCKKSKPTQVGEEASTKTLSSETTTAGTKMTSCERGVTPVAGESSREAGEPIQPAPKGITSVADGIVCADGASSGEVGNGQTGGQELLQSKDKERNERSCNVTEKPGQRDSSRRNSDTFTLETSTIAGAEIDKGNETLGVQEEQPSLILNKSETRNRSVAGLSLLAEGGLLVHDGSFDGIMEEEFQSPECTEDLAGFELGKQPLSLNGKAMDGSHISVPETQQGIEGAGSEKEKMDIPDTLTVAEFCNLFQNSDDALVDAKFGRETLVPVDLKTPEELEEYLQVLLIIKPDQEIHDWALTQLQTMLTKLQSGLQIQKQQMMKDKFPEIFQKLQSHSVGHKIPNEVSDLHSYCMKFSRNQFHEWNLKMKTQLEEDLKYGIEKLTPRVSKCSEGLIKIDSKMKELDDVMTNLDVAIGNLDEMSLPTEEEMDEFVNNKKRQTEWEAQNQETQITIDNMQKEKDSLRSKRDEVVQGVKHLEERKIELMRVNTDEERGLKNTDIARITENLATLHSLQEWRLEGSSESGNKLHFTFLNRSLDLTVEYDTEESQPTKLTQLILRSYLPDTACPIAKLIHRLILQTAYVEDLKAKHPNYSNLPMLLQTLSKTVVRARQLEREMRNIAFWHLVDINEYSLSVQFSSLKAHSSFRVTFDFNNCLLGEHTITAAHEIGRDMVQDVQRALVTVKPGPGQLTRTVDCLNQLLETLIV